MKIVKLFLMLMICFGIGIVIQGKYAAAYIGSDYSAHRINEIKRIKQSMQKERVPQCQTEKDCPKPTCAGCQNLCVENKCILLQAAELEAVEEGDDELSLEKGTCNTEEDCDQPRCPDCRNLCIQNKCTLVHCKDHGSYDWDTHKCVCDPGWTGQYCEKRIK